MSKLKKITRTVLSYCDIPEEIAIENSLLQETRCDTYVEYRITPKEEQAQYSDNFDLDNWIISEYPYLEGMTILIHMDY